MDRRQFIQASSLIGLGACPIATKSGRTRNVLVLGGTGFFGPVLVEELIRQGHQVSLFNRGMTNPHLFPQVERITGNRETPDGTGLQALRDDNRTWDWVVDTWRGSSKAVADSVQILADRCAQYQYVSTVSVYDKWDDVGIDEDAPLNPLPAASEPIISENRYAIRKTFAEQVLRTHLPERTVFFRSHGMRGYPSSAARHEPYWQVKIARGKNLVLPADISHYQVTDMLSLAQFMIHCGEQKTWELTMWPTRQCSSETSFKASSRKRKVRLSCTGFPKSSYWRTMYV